jgi:UDP-galactopyranose mutase
LSVENRRLLKKYQEENKDDNVKFIWRLWNFTYFDMDDTIKNVLDFLNN